jgi:uncharacterized protein (TIGR02284 family)
MERIMAVSTFVTLPQATIDKLQELVQINIDAHDGFEYAASKLENMTIASFFEQMAAERRAQADELAGLVQFNGETPDRSGSFAAAFHRTWMGIRDSVAGSSDYAVLAEAERGEDSIKAAYEEALQCRCGDPIDEVLRRHYEGVKFAHDRVRELRDSHAND